MFNADEYTVKIICERCGITQAEAAMAMQCSRSLVSHYVTGARKPPFEKLRMLAQHAVNKVELARSQNNAAVNVADREDAAQEAQSTRDPKLCWWSSHSQQYTDETKTKIAFLPVPVPFNGRPPDFDPPIAPPAPIDLPPPGKVHMLDRDLNQWVIEPEPQ